MLSDIVILTLVITSETAANYNKLQLHLEGFDHRKLISIFAEDHHM